MVKARNGVRHPLLVRQRALLLRKAGKTHREIASLLGISTDTAHRWVLKVRVAKCHKEAIEARRRTRSFTTLQKKEIISRLRPFQYKNQYTDEELLEKIRIFYTKHGRIPLKREFNAWHIYTKRFGGWNTAIAKVGFDPNPVLFAKRFRAQDGHMCDSFSEKIIDDWLHTHGIPHTRNIAYQGTRLTADFGLGKNILMEFFGLAGGQRHYDEIVKKKQKLAHKFGYKLIELYPRDIYPVNKLGAILSNELQSII